MTSKNMPNSGLIRMLVCDTSLLAGRLDEVPFDGHTSLIGENGIGKSSLLDLTPIFMGENMSAVVKSSKGKSFIEHNLPRNSSKIAFEYHNQNGELCSVILTPDPQGVTLRYRFVRGGLTRDMFIYAADDGQDRFVENEALPAQLGKLGRSYSRLVDTAKAYRAIMLGSKPEGEDGKDASFIAQMNNEFGLSPRRAPLTGLDRLLTQMLQNQVNIKQMLGVIARLATDNDISYVDIVNTGNARDSARWPEHYRAYQSVMALESVARQLGSLAIEHDVHQEDIDAYLAALSYLKAAADEAKEGAELKLQTLKTTKTENARARDAEEEQARAKVTAARQALKSVQSEIAQYQAEKHRLTAKSAPEAQAEVAKIPDLRQTLGFAQDHHDILTAKNDDIIKNMERLSVEKETEANRRREEHRKDTDAAREKLEAQRQSVDAVHDDELAKLRAAIAEDQAKIDGEINQAREALTALKITQANIEADPEFAKRLQAAEDKVQKATTAVEETKTAREASTVARDGAHAEWVAAEAALSNLKADLETAEGRIAQTEVELSPKDGSLLAFLRKHTPERVDAIGKLVPQDILKDTRLSPEIVSDEDALFGIKLDTDHIPQPAYLNIDVLNARLITARQDREKLQGDIVSAEDLLKRKAKARSAAQKHLDAAEAEYLVAVSKSGTANKELLNVQIEHGDHLKVKQSTMDKDIETASLAVDAVLSKREQAATASAEQEKNLITGFKTRKAEIDTSLKKLATDLRDTLKSIENDLSSALDRIVVDRRAALTANGIDEKTLLAAEAAISSAKAALRSAQNKRELADLWSRHLERSDEFQALGNSEPELGAAVRAAEAAAQAVTEKWQAVGKALIREQDETEAARDVAVKTLSDIATRAGTMCDGITPAQNIHTELGASAVLTGLLDKQSQAAKLKTDGSKLARKLNAAFNSCKDPSITAYLDHLGDKRGEPGLSWASHMLKWYNEEHLDTRDILMNGLSSSIAPIIGAYHTLIEIDKAVSTLGRKMAKAIRQNTNFHHVTDVDITMRSGICSGELWTKLSALNDAHVAWKANSEGGAPSEELVEAISDLLSHCDITGQTRVNISETIFLEGSLREGGNLKVLNRSTDLSDLSSTGNVLVIRLILFTALLTIMRKGRDIGVVWAVDEIAAMDKANLKSLLDMLDANGITLFTAAPDLTAQKQAQFPNRIRLGRGHLLNFQDGSRTGIREWIDDETLDWPVSDVRNEEADTAGQEISQ